MNTSPKITVSLQNYYENYNGTVFLFISTKQKTEAHRCLLTATLAEVNALKAWKEELLATTKLQGHNSLISHYGSRYCCLAILGSISVDMTNYADSSDYLTDADFFRCIPFDNPSANISQSFQEFFSYLNDTLYYSFAQIAAAVQGFIDAFEAALSTQFPPKISYIFEFEK